MMFYHPTWEDVIASLHPREIAELGAILRQAEIEDERDGTGPDRQHEQLKPSLRPPGVP